MTLTRQLTISGQVQGVGFRWSLRERAAELHLRGWVRNRSDGSVEALVHGEAAAVEQLTDWARQGPRAARVVALESTDLATEPADLPDRFEQRTTA